MHIVLWIAIVVLAAANLIVCFRISRSESFVVSQKIGQMLMVWLAPVVGASLAWNFLREEKTKRHTTDFADRIGNDDGDLRYEKSGCEFGASDGGGADGDGD